MNEKLINVRFETLLAHTLLKNILLFIPKILHFILRLSLCNKVSLYN